MATSKRPPAPTGGKQRSFQPSAATTQPLAQNRPQLTREDLQAIPILRNRNQEQEVVKYVLDRLQMSDEERKRRAARAQDIDIQISGFQKLSREDRKRGQDNKAGKAPKPVNMS